MVTIMPSIILLLLKPSENLATSMQYASRIEFRYYMVYCKLFKGVEDTQRIARGLRHLKDTVTVDVFNKVFILYL